MLEEAKDADFVILNYQDFTICKTYLIGKWNDALFKADGKIDQNEINRSQQDILFINDSMDPDDLNNQN